jgi:RNA polymerase sigma-70 factor (ECF subfamily)
VFERRWALAVVDRAIERLQRECKESGKPALFQRLKPFLTGDEAGIGYESLAGELGMSGVALRVAVHRLRRSFRKAVRAEIAETVTDSAKVEDEIRFLWTALGD